MFVITMRLDWQLGLVALGVAPVLLLVSGIYRRRLREQWREVKKLESSALSVVQAQRLAEAGRMESRG